MNTVNIRKVARAVVFRLGLMVFVIDIYFIILLPIP